MRSHYVPEFYLRGFVDHSRVGGGRLWVADLKTGRIFRQPPRKAARSANYYTQENEEFFEKIETAAARPVQRLARGERRRRGDREAIAGLMASLLPRVPSYRRRNAEEIRAALRAAGTNKLLAVYGDGRVMPIEDPDDHPDFYLDVAIAEAGFLKWLFERMVWDRIKAAPSMSFITSDAPVHCIAGRQDTPAGRTYHPMQLLDAEMTFPVSPSLCLVCRHVSIGGFPGDPEALTTQMNIRRLVGADRYAYAPSRALAEWALWFRRGHPEYPLAPG